MIKDRLGPMPPIPTFTQELVLWNFGLKTVRNLMEDGKTLRNERGQRVLDALSKIGLFNFMRQVFKWQMWEVSSQFVLHWNQTEKKTRVDDVEIDASFRTFVKATGLQAEESAMAAEDENHSERPCDNTSAQKIWKRLDNKCVVTLEDFTDPWLQDLLLLLSTTIGMKTTFPTRLAPDLLETVAEALSGKRVRWSKIIHDKFICEVSRLKHGSMTGVKRHPDGTVKVLRTVAGPVMCFLYAHANHTRALAELDGLLPSPREKSVKVPIEFQGEPGECAPKTEEAEDHEGGSRQDAVSRLLSGLISQEVVTNQLGPPPKKSKLPDHSLPLVTVPTSSSPPSSSITLSRIGLKTVKVEPDIPLPGEERAVKVSREPQAENGLSGDYYPRPEHLHRSEDADDHEGCSAQDGGSRRLESCMTPSEVETSEFDHPAKRSKLAEQSTPVAAPAVNTLVTLQTGSPTAEDWAAKCILRVLPVSISRTLRKIRCLAADMQMMLSPTTDIQSLPHFCERKTRRGLRLRRDEIEGGAGEVL
ncbi:hypothetical protein R1flu_000167 [Riccia fluitans]|uniref:Uncharacterized protein n=1 Tax=Riccia fluitans TaxID=41844 RepID=A0ABD1XZP6_9MARC